ncbi:MAG: antA/AntB antirepressor family protein [Deltaproteobacteria bacterium]|nr:antA/AntB antirepressor family protein [Deltaproteobacteria bacterium]
MEEEILRGLTVRTIRIAGEDVLAVEAEELHEALMRADHAGRWFRGRARQLELEKGRDWIERRVPGPEGGAPRTERLLSMSAATFVAANDGGARARKVADALTAASAPPLSAEVRALAAILDAVALDVGKLLAARTRAKSPGRPRTKLPGFGSKTDVSQLADLWKSVRIGTWDLLAAPGDCLPKGGAAGLARDAGKLLKECGGREPVFWRFARALERVAGRLGNPFTFNKARTRLMYYDTATVRDCMDRLLESGALSKATRPNANGLVTDYWAMDRTPLAPRDRAWFRECLLEAEGKLEFCAEDGWAYVRGVKCADEDDPDWPKLSGPLPDWL